MRWLLVEAAWRILGRRRRRGTTLKVWAERIAARRGKRIAVVTPARRVAGILYASWRDDVDYRATPVARRKADAVDWR